MVNRYVYGEDHTPELILNGTSTYRVIRDQLGSVRGVVDASSGTVVQHIDYDAWGVPTVVSGASFQPLGYAGGLSDASTGLVRFGARDYDPVAARWTCKDPVGFGGGANQFIYVNNLPTTSTDPRGLCTLQLGFTFNLVGIGFASTASAGVAIDDRGNVAGFSTFGGGVGSGIGASGGVTLAASDAGTVNGLSGPFADVAVSGGAGGGASVEYFQGAGDSPTGTVHGIGVTIGPAGGGGASGTGTWTDIRPAWGPLAAGGRSGRPVR